MPEVLEIGVENELKSLGSDFKLGLYRFGNYVEDALLQKPSDLFVDLLESHDVVSQLEKSDAQGVGIIDLFVEAANVIENFLSSLGRSGVYMRDVI